MRVRKIALMWRMIPIVALVVGASGGHNCSRTISLSAPVVPVLARKKILELELKASQNWTVDSACKVTKEDFHNLCLRARDLNNSSVLLLRISCDILGFPLHVSNWSDQLDICKGHNIRFLQLTNCSVGWTEVDRIVTFVEAKNMMCHLSICPMWLGKAWVQFITV